LKPHLGWIKKNPHLSKFPRHKEKVRMGGGGALK
jgi:hypothetical protein